MAFKLKSGNKTSFKMMGSSPLRNDKNLSYDEHVAAMEKRKTSERLAKAGEELNKSMQSSFETHGGSFTGQHAQNRENSKAYSIYKSVLNEEKARLEGLGIDFDYGEYKITSTPGERSKTQVTKDEFRDVEFNDGSRIMQQTSAPSISHEVLPMPTTTISTIEQEMPTPNIESKLVKAKPLPEPKKKVKTKKVKKVRRPKGKRTRNLVTGGTNRTFRSTGTSRRKNRLIAGLTFWNPKD